MPTDQLGSCSEDGLIWEANIVQALDEQIVQFLSSTH